MAKVKMGQVKLAKVKINSPGNVTGYSLIIFFSKDFYNVVNEA